MTKRRKTNSSDPRTGGGGGDRPAGGEFYGSNPEADDWTAVWVESDVHADGRYGLTIRAGDIVRGLDRTTATAHANAVLTAAQRAEYDAATLDLLVDLGIDLEPAALTMNDIRQNRPRLDQAALAPLMLEPGVSSTTRKPFLTIVVGAGRVGQWSVDDARRHALAMLEAAEAVELDQALYDYLTSGGGPDVAHSRARAVVADIANHRRPS